MLKTLPTQDSSKVSYSRFDNIGQTAKKVQSNEAEDDVRIIRKPYVSKRLSKQAQHTRVFVSTRTFKKEMKHFDADMAAKYDTCIIVAVMNAIFKKAAERIITRLWRMPFPNGVGFLYMTEKQVSAKAKIRPDGSISDTDIHKLLMEVRLGMRGVFLKWNKEGRRFTYKNIWRMNFSKGFFRSKLFNEIVDRAEHPTKKNYRAHIV